MSEENKTKDSKNIIEIKPKVDLTKHVGRYVDSKHMNISPVESKSMFVRYNGIRELRSPITATQRVIDGMLNATNINKALLPMIVKAAPNSPHWNDRINDYWAGYSHIPINKTLVLDISFNYNDVKYKEEFDSKVRKAYNRYTEYAKSDPIHEATHFMQYNWDLILIEDEKNELDANNKPIYGSPVNRDHYIFWMVCLLLGSVAKRSSDLDKSNNIRHLLEDPLETQMAREERQNIKHKAEKLYYTIEDDNVKINNIVWLVATGRVDKLTMLEKKEVVRNSIDINPQGFIDLFNDKLLEKKAYLEQLITIGILKRIHSTGIIIDSMDSSVVIGNNIDEAIAYLNNPTESTKGNIDSYRARYNQFLK